MTEISDSLRSLFSAQIKEHDGSYTVDILSSKIEHDAFAADETYRITTLAMESSTDNTNQQEQHQSTAQDATPTSDGPPVDKVRSAT